MSLEWKEQVVSHGRAPWIAFMGNMTLFVQPWYGDGIDYRGIIQHESWTFTIKKKFKTLSEAKEAVEQIAGILERAALAQRKRQ